MSFFVELVQLGWDTLKDKQTKPSQKLANAGLAVLYTTFITALLKSEWNLITLGYQKLQSWLQIAQPYGPKMVVYVTGVWAIIAVTVAIPMILVKLFRGGATEMYAQIDMPYHLGTIIFVSVCIGEILSQRYVFTCKNELIKCAGWAVIYSMCIALFRYLAMTYLQKMRKEYKIIDVKSENILYNLRNNMKKNLFWPDAYGPEKEGLPSDNFATGKFIKKYDIYVTKDPKQNDELFSLLKRIVKDEDNFVEENNDGWLFECDPEKLPKKFQKKLYVKVWHKDSDGLYKYTISDEPIKKQRWYDKVVNFLFNY